MKFSELTDQAAALLERKGRVSYRALQREFEIDAETLEDLKNELIGVLEVAADKDGAMLVWTARASNESPMTATNIPVPDVTSAAEPIGEIERRQLTVMFCDLVGSTAMSESLDPEDLRDVMAAYQQVAGAVIQRYDGHVAQYLGDGLMVYFGWPMAHEEDAARAIRAAFEIARAVKDVAAPSRLQVRIGISTGPVVVGETGDGDAAVPKLAVGETPNIAARLQSLAGPDEIVISPTSKALAGAAFEYEDRGEQHLKGILDAIRVWRVVGLGGAEDRFEARAAGGLTPLVGRNIEIDLLLERWSLAKDGEGQVVLLSGEPGIGKSRITQALRERLVTDPHTELRYQCSPYHQHTAFFPIIDQLERAVALFANSSVDASLDKLEEILARGCTKAEEPAALIAPLLSLPIDRYPPLNLSSQRRKEKTYDALAAYVVGLAQDKPVLMVFEDAHWVDPTTLDVLSTTIDRLRESSVMMLITHRPEFDPLWTTLGHVTAHSLNRFSRKQGEKMVAALSGEAALPSDVILEIIEKTDGVPLFVEELTKTVIEASLTQSHSSNGSVNRADIIPATLQDSLMARLDRLGSGKEIAQLGACIGREFDYPVIASVTEYPEGKLEGALDRLIEAGLLYRQGLPPESSYSFKHALVQETAYQSLLKKRRQTVHGRIAETLVDLATENAESEPGIVAHHFVEAGLAERAIPYLRRAGERAAQRSANVEAIRHFTKALELLQTFPPSQERNTDELPLQMALGTAHMVIKGFAAPEIGKALDRADVLCREMGDRPEVVDVLLGLWAYHVSGQSPLQTARDVAEQLLVLAEEAENDTALLKAHIVVSINRFYQGEFQHMRGHLDQCIALYDRETHHRDFVATSGYDRGIITHCWSAMTYWMTGYPERALAASNEALVLAEALSHPYTSAVAFAYAAWVSSWVGDLQTSSEHAHAAARISDEHGFIFTWAWGTISHHAATIALHDGVDREDGVTQASNAVAKLRAAGIGLWMPHLLANMAEIHCLVGEQDRALADLEEASLLSRNRGDSFFDAEIIRLRGECHWLLHQRGSDMSGTDDVERSFQEAIAIAQKQGAKSLELRAAVSLARFWYAAEKPQEARALLEPICGWFSEGEQMRDLCAARSLLEAT